MQEAGGKLNAAQPSVLPRGGWDDRHCLSAEHRQREGEPPPEKTSSLRMQEALRCLPQELS